MTMSKTPNWRRPARHGCGKIPLILALASVITAVACGHAAGACPPAAGLPVTIDHVVGSDHLRLSDGRIIRLAGIAVPAIAEADARLFVMTMTRHAAIRLHPLSTAPDRYGRMLARLSLGEGDKTTWMEQALIAAGLALATLTPGENDCFSALAAAESAARHARAGYWGVDGAMVIAPSRLDEVSAAIGRFAVYEGKISRIAIRDYAIFLDFGEDWKRSLSIMLPRRQRAEVEAVIGPMQRLEGKTVQIRGIAERGSALRLRLTRPQQIRVIED